MKRLDVCLVMATLIGCSNAPDEAKPKPKVGVEKVAKEPATERKPEIESTSGKPLQFWVDQFNNGDKSARETALQAVADRISPEALIARKHYSAAEFVRIGEPVVPLLIEIIGRDHKQTEVRYLSISLLEAMKAKPGKNTVPALMKALSDRDQTVRGFAAAAIGNIGPDAKEAVPDLIKLFMSGDNVLFVSVALGKMGSAPVAPLVEILKDESSKQLRSPAILILEDIGPQASEAVPQLKKLAESDPDQTVRFCAAKALKRISER